MVFFHGALFKAYFMVFFHGAIFKAYFLRALTMATFLIDFSTLTKPASLYFAIYLCIL